MAAVISGAYLAAQSLNLGDEIGTLAPGMEADTPESGAIRSKILRLCGGLFSL